MIRRHVLAALAEGIAAGQDDAARAAIARAEWLVRGVARRRLERALIEAALLAAEPNGFHDPEAARHVQRVAALTLVGADADFLDRAKVAEAYAALPAPRRPRLPVATITAVAVVLGLGATAAIAIPALVEAAEPAPPPAAWVKPVPPPVAGAFREGGRPPGDPAIERLFVEDLTDLVIEIDRERNRGRSGQARRARMERMRESPAIAARGPRLAGAWRALLAVLDRFANTPIAEIDEVARELRGQASVVSDELAAAGIGLFLVGLVRPRGAAAHATVYTYRVEEVVYVQAGTERRRVLSLRRLDPLNRSWALLGMQSDELGDPVVLLDKIDEHVATRVLPVLAAGAPFPLGAWDREGLAAAAGSAVREELLAALGADAGAAREIADLLAERARMVESWRDWLKAQGYRLGRLESLHLPDGVLDSLAGKIADDRLARAREIEARLIELQAARIADRVHGLVAASTRHHETQHALDDDRDTPLRYPAAVEALLGPAADDAGRPRRRVERVRSELSAYLSEIANNTATPQLSLWHLARNVFDRGEWGGAEAYVGVVIVEGLARHLGATIEQPIVDDGEIHRARLLAGALALARAPGERLRAAAAALWLELFGEPIVPIVGGR